MIFMVGAIAGLAVALFPAEIERLQAALDVSKNEG
jgi:hypothetical protein